ncbi:MAG: hypothetical protein HYY85_14375 [Deltaproteobacteria bacterium]|nr:hypothetical protein [Deltaproteobacteria bacterium]
MIRTLAAFALLAFATSAQAQSIGQIADWVEKEGKPQVIPVQVANTLGVRTQKDIPVVQKAYAYRIPLIIRGFNVARMGKDREFFLHRSNDRAAIVWRVSNKGKIISTVFSDASGLSAVPNDEFLEVFDQELEWWQTQMRK